MSMTTITTHTFGSRKFTRRIQTARMQTGHYSNSPAHKNSLLPITSIVIGLVDYLDSHKIIYVKCKIELRLCSNRECLKLVKP